MAGTPEASNAPATRRLVLRAGEVQEIVLAAGETVVLDIEPSLVTTKVENGNVVLVGPEGASVVLVAAADAAETINVSIGGSIASLLETMTTALTNIASAAGTPQQGGTGTGQNGSGGNFFLTLDNDPLSGNGGGHGGEGGGTGGGGGTGDTGGAGRTGGSGTSGDQTNTFKTQGTGSTSNSAPTDIVLSAASVAENQAGATIGALTAIDPDAGDTHSFSVDDARFEVVGGVLKLKAGTSLDQEATPSVVVNVTVADAGGLSIVEAFTISVTNVNETPSDIVLSGSSVAENLAGGAVGTLSVVDPDAGDTHSWSVDDARFEVVDGVLKLKDGVSLDHEGTASVVVNVTAMDGGGLTRAEALTVSVDDSNEAPSAVFLSNAVVSENVAGAVIGTLGASDPDANETHTFSISDKRFEIFEGVLKLAEGRSLNHEATPTIVLEVTAMDAGGLTSNDLVTITVTNVNETPSDIVLSGSSVAENLAGGTIGTLSVVDPDAGDSHSWSVDDARFEVAGGVLKLKAGTSLDREAEAAIDVKVTVTDAAGAIRTEAMSIAVTNVNEAPISISLSSSSVLENAAGAVVGTFAAADPDAGDAHSFSVLNDARFEVVGGVLKLKDGVSLDYETTQAVSLKVRATDAAGLTFDQNVTVAVVDAVERFNGTDGNDTLVGGIGADSLVAGGGTDRVLGGGGDDIIVYNADVLQWSSVFGALNVGSPTIAGSNEFVSIQNKARSYDAFDGGEGRDTMVMTSGSDALFLDDTYSPHPGASTEARVLGIELFEAGSGDDVIDLTSKRAAYTASATMNGGAGDDVLWAGDAADRLDGGEGNDNLWGGGGSDSLLGGAGADKLDGSVGDDVLEGGAGADNLIGGAGADRFVYRIDAIGAGDVIADFGAGDVLDVSQLLASLGGSLATASQYFALVQSGSNVALRVDTAGAGADASDALLVTIQNQTVAQVQAQTNFG